MCKIFSSVFWVGVICYFGCNFLQFLVSKIYFCYLVCLKNFNLPYEVSYPLLNMVKCDSRCYRALKKLVRVSLGGINMGFTKVKNKVKTEYWRKALPKKRDKIRASSGISEANFLLAFSGYRNKITSDSIYFCINRKKGSINYVFGLLYYDQ